MSRSLGLLGVALCVSLWLGLQTVPVDVHLVQRLSAGEKAPPKRSDVVDVKTVSPTDLRQIVPAEQRIRAALNEKTETGFVDTPPKEAMSFLSDLHNIEILMDEPALDEAEGLCSDNAVNLDISGVTLRSALNIMLKPMQLTYVIDNEVLMITTTAKANERLETHVYDVRGLAKADFDSEQVAELVERATAIGPWRDTVTSIVFLPDEKTVALKNGERTLQLWDVATGKPKTPLKRGLGVVRALPGSLVVTHTQRAQEQVGELLDQLERRAGAVEPKRDAAVDLKRIGPAEQRIRAALKQETETGFVDTPLKEALSFLAELHKIEILIDETALSEEGLNPEEPINLDVSGFTLRSALRIMFEPLQLTYVIENEVMMITTVAHANTRLETHVYDVRGLAKADLDNEHLAEMVQRTVAAGSWRSPVTSVALLPDKKTVALKSGEQTLQLWDARTGKPKAPFKQGLGEVTALPGTLVVTHTQRVHEKIAGLLAQLQRLTETEEDD